jgi:predicted metal-dependent hydrolase
MATLSQTPADLTLTSRDLGYSRAEHAHERWWLRGDPVATAVFNALSATFPEGERYFIETVARYKDEVPEALKAQVKTFVRQEALHTREHLAFNRQAAEFYDLAPLEARTVHRLTVSRTRHPVGQLASTVALEHFTAIFAHVLLTQPKHLEGAPEEIAKLWRWHSIEEIEHKAVAFDTYMAVMAKASPWKRWKVRNLVACIAGYHFLRNLARNVAELLRQDGIDWRTRRWSIYRQLFVSPGLFTAVAPHLFAYFLPGFHPWGLKDRALIAETEAELALA